MSLKVDASACTKAVILAAVVALPQPAKCARMASRSSLSSASSMIDKVRIQDSDSERCKDKLVCYAADFCSSLVYGPKRSTDV